MECTEMILPMKIPYTVHWVETRDHTTPFFLMVTAIMNNWSIRQSIPLYFSVVLEVRRMPYGASAIVWSL